MSLTFKDHASCNGCWVSYSLGHGGEAGGVAIHHQADVFGLQLAGWVPKPHVVSHDDHVSLARICPREVISGLRISFTFSTCVFLICGNKTGWSLTEGEFGFQMFCQSSQHVVGVRHRLVAQHLKPEQRHTQKNKIYPHNGITLTKSF